jgi:transposase
VEDRAALTGILFVLRAGLPWEMLPAEMGGSSGMSCRLRLRARQAAGVWSRLHHVLLERLPAAGEIDRSWARLNSASVSAKKGACRRPEPDGAGHQALPRYRRARHAPHRELAEPSDSA